MAYNGRRFDFTVLKKQSSEYADESVMDAWTEKNTGTRSHSGVGYIKYKRYNIFYRFIRRFFAEDLKIDEIYKRKIEEEKEKQENKIFTYDALLFKTGCASLIFTGLKYYGVIVIAGYVAVLGALDCTAVKDERANNII